MVSSQNGYSANDRSQIETYQIGGKTKVALRKGPTGWLLQHLGNWFDANIRDIDPGILDDWGYAERPIRGGTELSNHASGTALDVDATRWPLGVEPTKYLTKAEIAKLKEHLKVYEGAIRWGGDYTGRKDPMHFEIDKPEAFCARVQVKLQGSDPFEEDDMSQYADQLNRIERALVGYMPAGQNNFHWVEQNGRQFDVYRSFPEWGGTGEMALAAPGFWWIIPDLVYLNIYISKGLCAPTWVECTPDEFKHLQDLHLLPMPGRLTAQEVADAVVATIPDAPATPPVDVPMTDEQIERMAALIAEEIDQETATEWQARVAEHAQAVADELADRFAS